jgi:N-methylhydantoinase B
MECFEINPDSAGAGKYRGGLGIRRSWKVLTDDVTLNLRLDRFKSSSPGLFGAHPSARARCTLNPGGDGARPLHSKAANVQLAKGDTLLLELGGGGGWGDPLTRELGRVVDDVRDGYVSPRAAREIYGVVVDPVTMTVDATATKQERKKAGNKRATDRD